MNLTLVCYCYCLYNWVLDGLIALGAQAGESYLDCDGVWGVGGVGGNPSTVLLALFRSFMTVVTGSRG